MLKTDADDIVGHTLNTPRRFLRISRVVELTGLRPSTLYLMMSQGSFPKSIPLGPRIRAWDADEVRAWQEDRLAAREES